MKYDNIVEGVFTHRPNRFIAIVEIEGIPTECHVKNTGRCKELLIKGVRVFLEKAKNPMRKTKYDLIAVYKGEMLINMDSLLPNKVFFEWASTYFSELSFIKGEVKFENSRFDFYLEHGKEQGKNPGGRKKAFVEVKGVTLEENGVALFPDAPTQRGVKHINELIKAVTLGYEAYICFVIQMEDVKEFKPNDITHIEFGNALRQAEKKGVKIIAVNSTVEIDEVKIKGLIPVVL